MRPSSTIASMENQYSSHSWLSAFADKLMQLRPSMSPEQAVRRAVASIHQTAGLDPRIAAEIFAMTHSSGAPAAVPRERPTAEPQVKRYRERFGVRGPASVDGRRA
jgi:hypothetical protein